MSNNSDDSDTTTMTDDTQTDDELEAQYLKRNGALQTTIDTLAEYERDEIEEHGMKTQIARDHDLERHRIDYVLTHYPNLVRWRRGRMRDPVEPEAVKAAYEDDTLAQMAASDGGKPVVSIELTLDEAFRAMKLLPGDMGLNVYRQLLTEDFDRAELKRLWEDK